jgi:hypothetical protein
MDILSFNSTIIFLFKRPKSKKISFSKQKQNRLPQSQFQPIHKNKHESTKPNPTTVYIRYGPIQHQTDPQHRVAPRQQRRTQCRLW